MQPINILKSLTKNNKSDLMNTIKYFGTIALGIALINLQAISAIIKLHGGP